MSEKPLIDQIIKALQTVPPVNLKIIELANKLPISYGQFAPEAIRDNRTDIKLAMEEANIYGGHTINAVKQLVSVMREYE